MKLLLIGDVHCKKDDLEDCEKLLKFIYQAVSKDLSIDGVVFLGDLFHTHSVVHLPVYYFWNKWLQALTLNSTRSVYLLVGNHDMDLANNRYNALTPLWNIPGVKVIADPWREKEITFLPYYGEKRSAQFYKDCQDNPNKILFCHDTFDGARYENGFYAINGFNHKLAPFELIISGHLHTPHAFDNIVYIGSPRWQTMSDANVSRNIVKFDTETLKFENISVDDICKRILVYQDTKDKPFIGELNTKDSTTVEIFGSVEYVKERTKYFKDKGAKVKPFIDKKESIKAKESDGIAIAFDKYIDLYEPKNGTSKEELKKMVKESILWTI